MANSASTRELKKAYFQAASEKPVYVHFNPQTLQFAITNRLANTGSGATKKQFVSSATGKLSMETVFDTTGSGENVRLATARLGAFMMPGDNDTPPVVTFKWGVYEFVGMFESYDETIDFFSPDGVPLRATVKLAMASQDQVFAPGASGRSDTGGDLSPDSSLSAPAPPGLGVTATATLGGNPGAGRALASANGLASMRFAAGGEVDVDASVNLRGPEVFASAGAGAGGGFGIDIGGGAAAGIGGQLSAGVGASAGAFGGLRAGASAGAGVSLNVGLSAGASATGSLGLEDAGGFCVGGAAGLEGSASMKTDVGVAGALNAKIEFDGG